MSIKNTIAIECSDRTLSALFFDKIIPLTNSGSFPQEVKYHKSGAEIALAPIGEIAEESKKRDITVEEAIKLIDNIWAFRVQSKLTKNGISSVPFYKDSELFKKLLPKGTDDAIELKLANIGVIDDSLLEWDQVLEVRTDVDSVAKLRRFRLFLTEKCSGKSESYIRDSLLTMIYDYEQACKKHGLTLITSTISKVLNSKSLLGALGITAAGILTGTTAVVGAGIVGGSVVEIGKVALHISEKKLEIESLKNTSEIAYLMAIREKTANK